MNIHIQFCGIQRKVKNRKGKFMHHSKGLVSILDGLGNDWAFYISSIYKVIFIGTVSSADDRLSDKSRHLNIIPLRFHWKKIGRNISSVNVIKNILQASVSRCMQPILPVIYKLKGNLRMGHGQTRNQIADVAGFCHIRF